MKKRQLLFCLMIAWMDTVYCALVLFPKDAEVGVNGTVILDCVSSTSMFVKWTYCSVDGGQCNHINYGKSLQQNYNLRFTLDSRCSSGTCTLTIRSVQVQDFGQYCCRDKEGSGESKCSQLTVVKDIKCHNNATDGVISGTSCGIPSNKVEHTCRVSFKGQLPPVIVWVDLHGVIYVAEITNQQSQLINQSELVESSISQTASGYISRNGIQCRTQMSSVSCVSEYDAYYAFDSAVSTTILNGTGECTANASGPCTFSWRKADDPEFYAIGALLNFNSGSLKSGKYTCSANCSVESRFCQVTGTSVDYIPGSFHETDTTSNNLWIVIAGLSVCVVSLSVFLGAVIFFSEEIKLKVCGKCLDLKSRKQKTTYPNGSENRHSTEEEPLTAGISKGYEGASQPNSGDTRMKEVFYEILLPNMSNTKLHIRGVVVMGDYMYYVGLWSRDIKIYDLSKSEKLESILVPHLNNPWDLVKCNTNRFLYISEYENPNGAYVYKMDLGDRARPVHTRWPVADAFRKGWVRISVTEDNRIVVCGSESSRIEVYDADQEQLLHFFNLPPDPHIHNLQQAKLFGENKIVFVHGVRADSHNRICLVERGNAIKIDKFYGEDENDLNKPTDIVATKSGNIFVADFNNFRILMLNSELKFLREIRSKVNTKSNPCRLFIDDSEQYLYIGEEDGNISRLPLVQWLSS